MPTDHSQWCGLGIICFWPVGTTAPSSTIADWILPCLVRSLSVSCQPFPSLQSRHMWKWSSHTPAGARASGLNGLQLPQSASDAALCLIPHLPAICLLVSGPGNKVILLIIFYWSVWAVCVFWKSSCQSNNLQIFSHTLQVVFLFCLWFFLLCKNF